MLGVIIYLSVRIRTVNLSGLKDVTTNDWTLGPDLDPFFFLRLTKYIVEQGSLMAVDMMRYVPLGKVPMAELYFTPYLMAGFHKIAVFFGSPSVTYSAIMYPVFFFALTIIGMFLMTRKIFFDFVGEKKANAIALIASLLLTVIPVFLPRTIAGIPEKESAAFFFMFMAFYFFISGWKSKSRRNQLIFGLLAGISTATMGMVWGGYAFIFLAIAPAVFIAFVFGLVDAKRYAFYSVWLFSSIIMKFLYFF